ncbi:unnamed protein product [Thlaspi arvense]|uniref:GH16 domain-containing protein n=1 Tax=Thlaspi arvense TaxID=13288 RepID=A0AAU9RZN7_THLAR|nr:unnamed protein product [Thlaspi arvense]
MTLINRSKPFVLLGLFIASLLLWVSKASLVSSGDFNKDFFVTWSPTHINTSSDGRSKTLKLDQESGNVIGQPYILQTNVYADGIDNREERIHLWFDPTKDFHTYTILWNIHQIVFMVDQIPIRLYRNHNDKGVAFPRLQPMSLKASLWNGERWATRGERDKIDWSRGPFVAFFGNYKIDACIWKGNPRSCSEESNANWWNKNEFSSLTRVQKRWFK